MAELAPCRLGAVPRDDWYRIRVHAPAHALADKSPRRRIQLRAMLRACASPACVRPIAARGAFVCSGAMAGVAAREYPYENALSHLRAAMRTQNRTWASYTLGMPLPQWLVL